MAASSLRGSGAMALMYTNSYRHRVASRRLWQVVSMTAYLSPGVFLAKKLAVVHPSSLCSCHRP